MPSKSIHIAANGKISFFFFLWLSSVCMCVCLSVYLSIYLSLYVYMSHNFFIHSIDRYLGCFHTLAIVDNVAMTSGVHVSLKLMFFFFFFVCIPKSRIARSYGSSSFSLLRNLYTIPERVHQFTFQQCTGVPFSPFPCQHLLFMFFLMIAMQTSLVAQTVKRLSTIRETWVRSLGWKIPWRRKWQSTPVLLPGKSHGQGSWVGYSPWGRKESDRTERLHFPSLSLCWKVRGDIMWLWFAFPWWIPSVSISCDYFAGNLDPSTGSVSLFHTFP